MESANNGNQAMNQIPMGPQRVNITAADFAAKYRSKRECYNFLTLECKAFLCHPDCLTGYHLRDLMMGVKRSKWQLNCFLNLLL